MGCLTETARWKRCVPRRLPIYTQASIKSVVFQSRLFKSFSFLALLAVFVSVAASQSDQPAKPEPDLPTVTVTPTPAVPDNATINLHRWGAVTLFHGLPSDRVNAIAEDASGVLWFGTDEGLVRYDGRNVETAPNEAALPSRRILALKLDQHGRGRGAAARESDRGLARNTRPCGQRHGVVIAR